MPAVDPRRTGALLAGAGGALLAASMFLPWFGLDVRVELPGDLGTITTENERLNAWEAFAAIDLLLFVSAVLGLALAARALLSDLVPRNTLLPTAVAVAGALSALLIVYRLLDPPSFDVTVDQVDVSIGRRLGAFFALLGAAGLALGAQRALAEAAPAPPEQAPRALDGFEGWLTIDQMRNGGITDVPTQAGVYTVLRETAAAPSFLAGSPGAPVKGRDPTVTLSSLEANWVEGAQILYIGRAGALRRRLRELVRFGAGSPTSNWGGRLLWQLSDAPDLVVAWRLTGDDPPKAAEAALLADFRARHGKPPFANDPHRLGR